MNTELLANILEEKRSTVISILTEIATYQSVLAEIHGSVTALRGASDELLREEPPTINRMAVFHSSNALLYTYTLYVLIPSLFCKEILIRPSHQVSTVTQKLHSLFSPYLPNTIEMFSYSQRRFKRLIQSPDAIVFTGNYDNACSLQEEFSESLFLFFGSGTNPVIVTEEAVVAKAVSSIVEARMFNSGQDCMCPNVIFVHENISQQFINQLTSTLNILNYGEKRDPKADYSSIVYDNVIPKLKKYLELYAHQAIFSGACDLASMRVDPIVLLSTFNTMVPPYEYFSPVFNLVEYAQEEDVVDWLLHDEQLETAMGLSIFGHLDQEERLGTFYTVSINQNLFDIENGNQPFGGWGEKANFTVSGDARFAHPILISREIATHLGSLATHA